MNIVVKEGVRVNVKATRRIMKERGFRFRIFKNNPRRFSVFLNRKGREMYNNDIEAMMNIVFAFERDEIGRWSRDDQVKVKSPSRRRPLLPLQREDAPDPVIIRRKIWRK